MTAPNQLIISLLKYFFFN